MHIGRRMAAEAIGTFWLVFGGCGSAVLAAAFAEVGIGLLGVSLAFGLTVLTMAYARRPYLGLPSQPGGHRRVCGRAGAFPARDIALYVVAQVLGAIAAAGLLSMVASGPPGFDLAANGLAQNGYRERPRRAGYSMAAGLTIEVVLTAGFLVVILGATDDRAPRGFRTDRHRPGADADPPDQHSGHQHLGQSGAQHRAGADRGRARAAATVAVLGRAARGRAGGGLPAPVPVRRGRAGRHSKEAAKFRISAVGVAAFSESSHPRCALPRRRW